MNIKIKRLTKDVPLPIYATEQAAGFDLIAAEDVIIPPESTELVKTGLAIELPPGYELQIRPRSGITLKTKLRVQLGTIDADYRGEIGVIVNNINRAYLADGWGPPLEGTAYYSDGTEVIQLGDKKLIHGTYIIRKGDRIAQGIIAPIVQANFIEVEELSETRRGNGGFGHTGI
jgi:dUTP pyrophosphatase